MRAKHLLFVAAIIFVVYSLGKIIRTDTSNPESVLSSYLDNWQAENSRSMYPLLSDRVKSELDRQNIRDAVDYFAYAAEKHKDLIKWNLRSRHVGENASRFLVDLKSRDLFGNETTEETIFFLVLQQNGWRVDSFKIGHTYGLP